MEFIAKVNAEGKAFVKIENETNDPPIGSHDFIPIVSLDTTQLTSPNKGKYEYKDFEIVKNYKGRTTKLSKHLDKNSQPLHAIKIYKESIVRFTIKKGNTKANDNDGIITIKPHGVTVTTKKVINTQYGHAIALKINAQNITNDAYIDFYASDAGGILDSQGLTNIQCGRVKVVKLESFLVIYGSGWLSPTSGTSNYTGESFKLIAEARNGINKKNHPNRDHNIFYCPTDKELLEHINNSKNIKRLDIYSHAWAGGLNLGGFVDNRIIEGVNYDGSAMDWNDPYYRELRRFRTSEVSNLNPKSFADDAQVYFWGCNAGGQLTSTGDHVAQNTPLIMDPKKTFAQKFAQVLSKVKVYALVGKGALAGSMFKTDNNGENVYSDGEMLPANIALNHKNKNTIKLNALDYMKKFPL